MRLFIAEKPSLGRAIAAVLPKPHQNGEGFIRTANGDVVSWCIGHLLEQAEPEAYDPDFKQWRLDVLPIVPQQWQLQAKSNTRKQLSVLRKLVKEASQLVHAGDPDREGQLLVDEVIDFLKVPASKKASTQRLLISDLNPSAVSRALNQLKSNREFLPLSESALARSRADWLYGINLTRAYTVKGRQAGVNSVLSVGRVQTPVLGLVVRRDEEIEQFVSRPFYEVRAAIHLEQQQPLSFWAKWRPSEACAAHQDEDGRVLNPALAQHVAQRIRQQPARVTLSERKEKQQPAPLPYNLSSLQIDAAKAFGLNAKQVLDACQALYEKHRLITYPRSDCRYLPKDHFNQRQSVTTAIASNQPDFKPLVDGADLSLKSRAWNDSKVGAHHAIIPTDKNANTGGLNRAEQQLYQMISRQYLMQFYPAFRYAERKVELDIASGSFYASSKQELDKGWKALLPERSPAKQDGESQESQQLPELTVGQKLWSGEPSVDEKHTQPPAHFTDATLLAAMTGIARFVKSAELKQVLRETDGLGTEATRASILELLFKRGFLTRNGKQINATGLGKALIHCLPEVATVPDMTAHWERQLGDISEQQLSYEAFMAPMETSLNQLVQQAICADAQVFEEMSREAKAAPVRAGRRKSTSSATARKTRSGAKRSRSGSASKRKAA